MITQSVVEEAILGWAYYAQVLDERIIEAALEREDAPVASEEYNLAWTRLIEAHKRRLSALDAIESHAAHSCEYRRIRPVEGRWGSIVALIRATLGAEFSSVTSEELTAKDIVSCAERL